MGAGHVIRHGGGGGGREEPPGQKPHLLVLGEWVGPGRRRHRQPGTPRRRREGVGARAGPDPPAEGTAV